jgi:hypothetical protein
MDNLPKLKLSGLGWDETGNLVDFQQARYFPFSPDLIITVDGHVINSYQELILLTDSSALPGKPFLEVVFLPVIVGG